MKLDYNLQESTYFWRRKIINMAAKNYFETEKPSYSGTFCGHSVFTHKWSEEALWQKPRLDSVDSSGTEEALWQKPRLDSVDGSGDLRDFERLFIAA